MNKKPTQKVRNCKYYLVGLTFIIVYTDYTQHYHFYDLVTIHSALNFTLLVIVVYDGVLEDIGEGEADGVFLGLAARRFECTLFLQGPFTLVVCSQLITAHPAHQPLPLPQR